MSVTKKLFSSVLVLSLLAGCSTSSASAVASESTGKYTPGTYEGTGTGMGSITASVTVDANQITSIDLDLSGETESIGQKAGNTLVQQILDAQSTDIDGVSGATVTSKGVEDAVQKALDQASGAVASAGAIADGTYTGTAHGSRSEITVQVTVENNEIKNISVTDEADSPYISDAAFNAMPKRIIDAQSVAVDNVTGATLTSTGIRNAVDAALKSSGADVSSFEQAPAKEEKQLDDVTTNVLVVGGGASGLVAALAAKTDDQLSDTDSGLDVMIVESNGYAGGNLALCGGYVASYFGTELNDATGNTWDPNDLVDALEAAHQDFSDIVNDSLMRSIASENADVINGLINRGFYLDAGDAYEGTTTSLTADGSPETYTTSSVVADDEGDRSGDNGYDIYGGAARLAESLSNLVTEAGVDLRLETTAEELITDDNGAVTGVKVHSREGDYTIHADKVILCSGYAGLDQDTVDEFLPAEYSNVINAQNASNQSFAQKTIATMGGDTVSLLQMGYIVPGYNTVLAHYGEEGLLYRSMNALWVNANGERFFDESVPEGGRGLAAGAELLKQPDSRAWIIFDSNHEGVKYYDFLAEQGLAWRADTIEELANKAGLPADALAATIEKYNSDAASGTDTEFNTPAENMVPVETGPFYAVKVGASSPAGIDVSVYCNDQMQILLHKGGEPIGNLYGAGGVVSNAFITMAAIGLGTHVNASLLSGAYAGDCVRRELIGR